MVKIIDNCLTRGKVAKNILLVLVLFILILTISPQNVLAEETQRVNASEILVNITRGAPVEYTDCIIIGDLDISGIRDNLAEIEIEGIEKRIIKSPILIVDSTIQGKVNFNPIYFNDTVVFKNVTFEGVAFFWYATFNKTPDFQDSTFKNKADFGEATFNEGAFFERAKFKSASFNNASFNKSAFFGSTTFDGDVVFRDAIFDKKADFSSCRFNNLAYFFNATFNNRAVFQWATFNGAVSFKNATFNGTANFCRASFNGEVHSQNANFTDTAYFILAKFKDRAYFTNASFEDNADFSEADIFLTMKIRWSQLEGKLVYDDYFYQSLIRNFETLGQSDDADDAYYNYKVEKRKHINIKSLRGLIRRPLEFLFLDLSCGYGVKPLKPIRWAVFFIGVFAFLYWVNEEKDKRKRLREFVKDRGKGLREFVFLGKWKGRKNKKLKSDSSLKDRLKRLFGFLKDIVLKFVFLSVSIFTTLGYWNKWKPANETGFRILAIAEVFLGWIIMTLFVISLTMTWIR